MRNLFITIIAIFVVFAFNGCSPKMLEGVNPEGKAYNGAINTKQSEEGLELKIMTFAETNPKARFDLIVKAAAKEFDKKGIQYFSIVPIVYNNGGVAGLGISSFVTNTNDAWNYCFPSAFGLEVKCKSIEFEKPVFTFRGEVKDYFRPQWSVKEVLATISKEDKELILKEISSKEINNVK